MDPSAVDCYYTLVTLTGARIAFSISNLGYSGLGYSALGYSGLGYSGLGYLGDFVDSIDFIRVNVPEQLLHYFWFYVLKKGQYSAEHRSPKHKSMLVVKQCFQVSYETEHSYKAVLRQFLMNGNN